MEVYLEDQKVQLQSFGQGNVMKTDVITILVFDELFETLTSTTDCQYRILTLSQHDNLPIATGFAQLLNYCKSATFALLYQVFERLPLLICVQLSHVTILHHS